ncbi:hypothetical protein EHS13_08810 [Paenibacillus psychroresistens]|uniref:Uncharacterized protein n=1 Tax=Paenibacillus psychroresistens TaxID=1778678 RepID=A0A6B8RHA1_9BACL|nr:hypothetical protein [Paenibacillus psychroresistens]QGQ94975.1 hypothetical protein EHS13_08810 [Paenibacillus psychroresistens]
MIRKACKLDSDFQRSIVFRRKIEVWTNGKLEAVGFLEGFSEDSVSLDGGHYLREGSEFWLI